MMPLTPERMVELDKYYAGGESTLSPERIAELDRYYGEQLQERGLLKETGRQLGLTARIGAEGILSIPAMLANAPAVASNKILGTNFPEQNQAVSDVLTKIGLPLPKNGLERGVQDVGKTLVGTGGAIKAAEQIASKATTPITKNIAQLLAESPKTQAASAVTGSGAAAITREAGGGSVAQAITGLLGALAPAAVTQMPNLALSVGPQTSKIMESNLQTFKGAGTTPTVGQASEGRIARGIESLLSKIPGGAGIMTRKSEQQSTELGQGIDAISKSLAPRTSAEIAGASIEKGIKENFIPTARKTQARLYTKLDEFIPKETLVNADNTIGTLSKLTAPIEGAENLSNTSLLSNRVLGEAKSAIGADTGATPSKLSSIVDEYGTPFMKSGTPGSNRMPYQALKELRTRIGEKLESVDLAPDVPRAQLKQLYGALSSDMEAAARASGPKAYAAYKRANGFTKSLHERIEMVQGVIDKNGGPEKIFQAATSGAGEGATILRAVMKSLPENNQRILSAAVLRRLGRATPGNQNDVGDVFSANSFLTNWNKLSPEAKSVLFDNYGPEFRSNMDKIAKVTSNLRDGSKVFSNPSGTAQVENLIKTGGTIGTGVLAFFTGYPGVAATAAGGIGMANIAARAMTNPNFVKWLAKNANKPLPYLPTALTELNTLSKMTDDQDLKDISKELKVAK